MKVLNSKERLKTTLWVWGAVVGVTRGGEDEDCGM